MDESNQQSQIRRQRPNNREQQLIGSRVGSCEILEFVGRGGMGTVYKALHTTLNREVAIKILTNANQDEKAVEWFLREAQSIARLEHPNIIQVYDLAYDENLGTHYIVMQFVDGSSLDAMVKNSPQHRLDPIHAVNFILQTAQGLESAHRKKIIHRDIKPANIMVTSDGVVKITDFGLAKGVSKADVSTVSSGLIVGTPLYMAPEQCVGSEIDDRTDIYSLGITFYFLLTGKPPFTGANSFEILEKHITENPIPPDQLYQDIPPEITNVVMKMMAKIPNDRYQNCGEVAEALEVILEGMTVVECPICNQQNLLKDSFTCPSCKRKYLCRTHILAETQTCELCGVDGDRSQLQHVSGVDKIQLLSVLDDMIYNNKRGILTFQSGDYRLIIYIRAQGLGIIPPDYAIEQLAAQNRQYGPIEMASLLLIQVLSWEPFTWEFVEQKNNEVGQCNLDVVTEPSVFLKGYASIIETLEAINKSGSVVISSPMETIGIQTERNQIKLVSPVYGPTIKSKCLLKEEADMILERILSGLFKLEYRSTGTLLTEGATIEDSLAAVFLEILYQCPNFGFFSHLQLNIRQEIEIDTQQHRYQINPEELNIVAENIQQLLRQSIKQYSILERIGIPVVISVSICACIVKAQIIYILEKLSNFIKQFEEQDSTAAANILLEQALQLFPYNIKLLEELATVYENRHKFEIAANLWVKSGKVREKLGELELAKHCYNRAMELDINHLDARFCIYQLSMQLKNDSDIKTSGLAIIPLLRKNQKFDALIDLCQQLLKYDPDMTICHKELINHFLDNNQKEQALEYYGLLASAYKRQGNKDEVIRTYQKMLKINPNLQDIRFKLEKEMGVDVPIVKAAVTATSIIRKNMQSRTIPNIFLMAALFIVVLYVSMREWHGLNRMKFFQQQIKAEKFSEIKDDLEEFSNSTYFLGTHEKASDLYYQELNRQSKSSIEKAKNELEKKIDSLYKDYLPSGKYQKILDELYILQEKEVLIRPPHIKEFLLEIVRKNIEDINKKIRKNEEEEQQRLFQESEKEIKAGNFELARQLLKRLQIRDANTWSAKVEQRLIEINSLEEQVSQETKRKQAEQQKLYEYGKTLENEGELEKALETFSKTIRTLPNSKIAGETLFHLNNVKALLKQAEEYLSSAESCISENKYEEALQNFQKILNDTRWSNTNLAKNILLPLWIETTPVNNIECFLNSKSIGSSPILYRYKPKTFLGDIDIQSPSFKIVKREEIKSSSGTLIKLVLHLKRIPTWEFSTRGIIQSPVVVHRQNIYIGSRDSTLYCLNKDGNELWKYNAGSFAEIIGEMAIANNQLFFSTKKGLAYLLKLDGTFADPQESIVWNYNFKNPIYAGPLISNNTAFFPSSDGNVYSINTSGTFQVQQNFNVGSQIISSPIIISDSSPKIIISSQNGFIHCFDLYQKKLLWKVNVITLWKNIPANIYISLLYFQNSLYISTYPGGIACLDITTGNRKWSLGISGGVKAKPIIFNNLLWVASNEKNIFSIRPQTGEIVSRILTEGGFSANPCSYENIIFFGGEDFNIYAIDANTSKIVWKQSLPEKVFSQPFCNGTYIYIAAGRTLYNYWIKDIFSR